MRGFGWFEEMLDDPYRRVMLRGIGFLFFAMGLSIILYSVRVRIPERLRPIENPVATVADLVTCERSWGGRYRITVDGGSYFCDGADSTCPTEPNVQVVYDRLNPKRCRKASNNGRLSVREWVAVATIGPAFFAFGCGLMLARNRDRNPIRRAAARLAFSITALLAFLLCGWRIVNGEDWMRLGPVAGHHDSFMPGL